MSRRKRWEKDGEYTLSFRNEIALLESPEWQIQEQGFDQYVGTEYSPDLIANAIRHVTCNLKFWKMKNGWSGNDFNDPTFRSKWVTIVMVSTQSFWNHTLRNDHSRQPKLRVIIIISHQAVFRYSESSKVLVNFSNSWPYLVRFM